jgi:hypothetical protein
MRTDVVCRSRHLVHSDAWVKRGLAGQPDKVGQERSSGLTCVLPDGSMYQVIDGGMDRSLFLAASRADDAVNAAAADLGLSGCVPELSDEG